MLKLDSFQVEDMQRYHFGGRLCQPAACRRSGYTMTYREIEVTRCLDEGAKAMVVSALGASRRNHASMVTPIALCCNRAKIS